MSICFSCFLGLLYTLLLVFHVSLQPNKCWYQKHIVTDDPGLKPDQEQVRRRDRQKLHLEDYIYIYIYILYLGLRAQRNLP
jgi:hypothetical protein